MPERILEKNTPEQLEALLKKKAMDLAHKFSPEYAPILGVSKGWALLIEALDSRLSILDPKYTIFQVKQKLGGLRFYAAVSTNVGKQTEQAFNETILEYQRMSFDVCENCGVYAPGNVALRRSGFINWLNSYCDDCSKVCGPLRRGRPADDKVRRP